jgi:hypothetical protein
VNPNDEKDDALSWFTPELHRAGATDIEVAYQVGGVLARCQLDGRLVQVASVSPVAALVRMLALCTGADS